MPGAAVKRKRSSSPAPASEGATSVSMASTSGNFGASASSNDDYEGTSTPSTPSSPFTYDESSGIIPFEALTPEQLEGMINDLPRPEYIVESDIDDTDEMPLPKMAPIFQNQNRVARVEDEDEEEMEDDIPTPEEIYRSERNAVRIMSLFYPYESFGPPNDYSDSEGETSAPTPIRNNQSSNPVVQGSSNDSEGTSCNLGPLERCTICYVQERTIVFQPCGHFAACVICASALNRCPVCRNPFESTVRAYLS